jgi:hypothetical protein
MRDEKPGRCRTTTQGQPQLSHWSISSPKREQVRLSILSASRLTIQTWLLTRAVGSGGDGRRFAASPLLPKLGVAPDRTFTVASNRLGQLSSGFDDYELSKSWAAVDGRWSRTAKSLDRVVALKIWLARLHARLARFARSGNGRPVESSAHRPIYEVGQHNELPYFTMRYVRGTTLAGRIAQGPLTGRGGVLLVPIARAIAGPHQKGVLHRDRSPPTF